MFKILATPREILCSTRCGLGAICKRWERWSLVWHGVPLVTKTELKNWMLEQLVKSNGCSSIQFYGSFIKLFGARNFKKILLSFLGASKFHFLKYRNFFRGGTFYFFEIGKLRPEIEEKYKGRKLHFRKYMKVPLYQGSKDSFPEA